MGMKISIRQSLVAAAFFLPLCSEAALWSSVISNSRMRAEVDLASLMRQGYAVTVWDRETYFAPEQARPGDFYFKSAKTLMRYHCDTRTADMLMKVYYADDGSEIKAITASYYGRPNYVIPDTDGEQKFEFACNYKKVSEKAPAAVSKKKKVKDKEQAGAEADKAAQKPAKKEEKAGAAKAKPAPKEPPKTPPRSVPIRKPSEILFRAPPAEPEKDAVRK